jgi:general secretion pathway protein L
MISRAFNLWTEGLATALVWARNFIRRPKRFQLRSDSQQWVLYSLEESSPRQVSMTDVEHIGPIPPETLRQTRGGSIEIAVPAAAIMERNLDPLPAESRPFLENVVRHQIETILPWRAADILYSTRVEKLPDGRLNVSVQATPRSAIAAALAAAEAYRAGEIFVASEGEPAIRILASVGAEKRTEMLRARLISRYAILGAMVSGICLIAWTTFVTWSLTTDVSALDQAIAERRAIIERKSASGSSIGNNWLEAKKRQAPLAVVVLDELSSILPAETYLTDLSLESGRLRLAGVSANAAGLVPLLEGSKHFKNASFFTPTTRIAGNSADRFSIEAVTVTGSGAGK